MNLVFLPSPTVPCLTHFRLCLVRMGSKTDVCEIQVHPCLVRRGR